MTATESIQVSTTLMPGKEKRQNEKRALFFYRLVVYLVLILLTILCLFPFYILLVNASRSSSDIQKGFSWTFGNSFGYNWTNLFGDKNHPVGRALLNSLLLALANALLSVYFSALTAYATYAYRFKGRKFIETFILMIMMIPNQVAAMGMVIFCINHHLTDNYWILTLPSIAAPAVYFYMKQYMEAILPFEIIEAARVDGTSEIGIFHKIVLPILKPALAVQFIFAYVGNWNNFFTPSMLLNKENMKTIPLIIAELTASSPDSFDLGKVYMLLTVAVIPVLIVYLIFSKGIIKNLTNGAVKG
jgi:multiple sugar transport system permease protein